MKKCDTRNCHTLHCNGKLSKEQSCTLSNCKTPHNHVIHFISNDTHLDIKTTNQNILLPLSSSPRVTSQLLQMSKMRTCYWQHVRRLTVMLKIRGEGNQKRSDWYMPRAPPSLSSTMPLRRRTSLVLSSKPWAAASHSLHTCPINIHAHFHFSHLNFYCLAYLLQKK